jgi:hypothetical protein
VTGKYLATFWEVDVKLACCSSSCMIEEEDRSALRSVVDFRVAADRLRAVQAH